MYVCMFEYVSVIMYVCVNVCRFEYVIVCI